MSKIKVQTGLRLDEELYEKVKVLAALDGRSINNLVEFIVRCYVAEYEGKHGPVSQYQN